MRAAVIAVCTILSAAPSALAGECADQTQSGLNACADAAYRKADAALNGAYREITRRLKDDAKTAKLLVTAQKAWIGYRDAECTFSSSANAGGSIYPMVFRSALEGDDARSAPPNSAPISRAGMAIWAARFPAPIARGHAVRLRLERLRKQSRWS